MATRAEAARSAAERSGPKKEKKPKRSVQRGERYERAERDALKATSGRPVGAKTARSNIKRDDGKTMTFALEDAPGRPSRKSTRKSTNHMKADENLRRRAMRRDRAPKNRAVKAKVARTRAR
jgi:hypothetical protein